MAAEFGPALVVVNIPRLGALRAPADRCTVVVPMRRKTLVLAVACVARRARSGAAPAAVEHAARCARPARRSARHLQRHRRRQLPLPPAGRRWPGASCRRPTPPTPRPTPTPGASPSWCRRRGGASGAPVRCSGSGLLSGTQQTGRCAGTPAASYRLHRSRCARRGRRTPRDLAYPGRQRRRLRRARSRSARSASWCAPSASRPARGPGSLLPNLGRRLRRAAGERQLPARAAQPRRRLHAAVHDGGRRPLRRRRAERQLQLDRAATRPTAPRTCRRRRPVADARAASARATAARSRSASSGSAARARRSASAADSPRAPLDERATHAPGVGLRRAVAAQVDAAAHVGASRRARRAPGARRPASTGSIRRRKNRTSSRCGARRELGDARLERVDRLVEASRGGCARPSARRGP